MRRLGRLAAALGIRTNPILWLLAHLLVPWDFIFSYRLELVKKEIAHLLPRWLDAWYELEALNSLANFAYLNPHYVFPELTSETNRLAAQGLGHPLLKPESKVCNDFELDNEQKIVILTGSNMAGKSTFSQDDRREPFSCVRGSAGERRPFARIVVSALYLHQGK